MHQWGKAYCHAEFANNNFVFMKASYSLVFEGFLFS